jgi:hypothetical protein
MKPWKYIGSSMAFIAVCAVAIPFGLDMHKTLAGTPELEQKIELVSKRLDEKIDKDRMNAIQERMWALEAEWLKRFRIEHDRLPESMEELILYMPEKVRKEYRQLEEDLEELKAKNREKEKAAEDEEEEGSD